MFHNLRITMLLVLLLFLAAVLLMMAGPVTAQRAGKDDYLPFYEKGDYKKSLEIIRQRLDEIYDRRVEDKRIPTDFISTKKLEEGFKLNQLFRKRVVKGFFIENNPELFTLHLAAARCYYRLPEYDASLNHYYQALRFKPIEYEKDDVLFHEMAQVYRKMNQPRAYSAFLEEAYTLNPGRSEYSLELGRALSRTNEKKKAIYHLGRYIESKGEVDDPDIYLMIGNLNEDIGRYLETVRHYRSYLAKKPEDGYIHFALGYLAYKRIGDYSLAVDSFDKALKYLPEKDILRRSKANEYKGDIFMQELEFEKAAGFYAETLRYQNEIKTQMDGKIREILKIKDDIRSMKSSLIKSQDYDKYNEYERFQEEKGKMELDNREKNYEFGKLNAGKVCWNMAESYERLGRLDDAMKYYREAVALNYQTEQAREKIIKLQLKINRGY